MSLRRRNGHLWPRDPDDWYVEPEWISERLFEVETFKGEVFDPACGIGRILDAAAAAGLRTRGADIVDRRARHRFQQGDFLTAPHSKAENVVVNPPFRLAREFALKALEIATRKVAIVFPTARLNAATWLASTPLSNVLFISPRPSMPPGTAILSGAKPGGGRSDFCWLVWERDHRGTATVSWLRRASSAASPMPLASAG